MVVLSDVLSICYDALDQFNDDACKVKLSIKPLLKELEQLKLSPSTKSAAANKFTAKHKKRCQMLRSL